MVSTTHFVQRVFLPHLLQRSQKKPLMYFDNAPCHKSPITTDFMSDINFDYEFIPPRHTNLVPLMYLGLSRSKHLTKTDG